ncbi:hypothetical protein [Streptomyces sp. NPDC054901]
MAAIFTGVASPAQAAGGPGSGGEICYRAHVAGLGWDEYWSCDGEAQGTTNQNRAIEAVMIKVNKYIGEYCLRGHLRDIGWTDNTCTTGGNDVALYVGTTGQNRPMEAFSLYSPSGSTNFTYNAHIQNKGWTGWWYTNGGPIGSTGEALNLEAFALYLKF